jgi:hypothetical protein
MTETQENTTTAPVESGQSSYVQSLIGPAGDFGGDESTAQTTPTQPTATDTETASVPDATATQADGQAETAGAPDDAAAKLADVEKLIEQFAKETGLNPKDPNQRKTLKRLADKELFIQKLQADHAAQKQASQPGAQTGPELLTAFEKELAAESGQKEGEQPQPAATDPTKQAGTQATTAAAPQGYGDVGDAWKTPEDSLSALNEAWAANDLKKVHEVEMARFRRNFDSGIAPQLLNYVNQLLDKRFQGFVEKDLGDIVPEVRRGVTERRAAESREFAIGELRKAGAEDIEKLFEAEDGPPITYEGEQFPNTPLNRILAKHPELMRIQETHADPAKAERRTFISRYKLAYQIYKQGAAGVPAATAKQLVDAGREAKERETADRTRQGINAGPGATGRGDKPRSESYVAGLNNLPGEVPFSSLLS